MVCNDNDERTIKNRPENRAVFVVFTYFLTGAGIASGAFASGLSI